jgi:hypothetical protein
MTKPLAQKGLFTAFFICAGLAFRRPPRKKVTTEQKNYDQSATAELSQVRRSSWQQKEQITLKFFPYILEFS